MTSTISHTKNHLSELLQRVQRGETLVILDRDRPVARVERIDPSQEQSHLVPPKSHGKASSILKLPIGGKKARASGTVAALLEERADDR